MFSAVTLTLVRYKNGTNVGFFWTENQSGVDVHLSPMFSNKESAEKWLREIVAVTVNTCCKMKGVE